MNKDRHFDVQSLNALPPLMLGFLSRPDFRTLKQPPPYSHSIVPGGFEVTS